MKHLFFIIILLISVIEINAQEEDFNPIWSLGIKQGINYSSINFSPRVKQGITLGYHGGLVYKYRNEMYPNGWIFGLQLELNYSQKGWTENLDTVSNSYNRNMSYVELPIIAQVEFGKRPLLKYYLNLGTTLGYLLSEKENLEVNNELYRREYYEKEIENVFDYSGLAELGLTYNSKIGEFQMGVRYQLSFTDLFITTSDTYYDNSQNSILTFSITYFFLDNKK